MWISIVQVLDGKRQSKNHQQLHSRHPDDQAISVHLVVIQKTQIVPITTHQKHM